MAKFSVGLDLGDGESVIAWLESDSPRGARLFERSSGEVSVLTALADTTSGVIIGEDALISPEARLVRLNFKSPPLKLRSGLATSVKTVEFAKLLLIEFFDRYPNVSEDCDIYVGHPAGWSASEVDLYQRQLLHALEPKSLTMVAESQSAFVDIHDSRSDASQRPAMVIDVGSSTTDFTVVDTDIANLPLGSELGCSEIDEELAKLVVSALGPSQRRRLEQPTPWNILLFLCRRWKEATFSGEPWEPPHRPYGELNWVVSQCWETLQDLDVAGIIDAGWRRRFTDELFRAFDEIGERPPVIVLITGGGSRMPFVFDECAKVFGPEHVAPVADPSLSVARGLASFGRWSHRVAMLHEAIEALPVSIGVESLVREHSRELAHTFYRSFYVTGWHKVVANAIADADGEGARPWTYRQLMTWYFKWLASEDGAAERHQILGPLEDAINARLEPEVARMLRQFGLAPAALKADVSLPTNLMVRPIGKLMSAFDVVCTAHGLLSQAQSRTQWGRRYLAELAPPLAAGLSPLGGVLASGYRFTSSDLHQLARVIGVEVQEQVRDRARVIEMLLRG